MSAAAAPQASKASVLTAQQQQKIDNIVTKFTNLALQNFCSALGTFISDLKKQYKRDPVLQEKAAEYEVVMGNELSKHKAARQMVQAWYTHFHKHRKALADGRLQVVQEINHNIMTDLSLKFKFQDAPISRKRVIMAHLKKITFKCIEYMSWRHNGYQKALELIKEKQRAMAQQQEELRQMAISEEAQLVQQQTGMSPMLANKIQSFINALEHSGQAGDFMAIQRESQKFVQTLQESEVAELERVGDQHPSLLDVEGPMRSLIGMLPESS
jgi:hypothetical protein